MEISSQSPQDKWDTPTFTIKDIDQNTLSLILAFAGNAIINRGCVEPYGGLLEEITRIEAYVNAHEHERKEPLEL